MIWLAGAVVLLCFVWVAYPVVVALWRWTDGGEGDDWGRFVGAWILPYLIPIVFGILLAVILGDRSGDGY